ncbi:MAG TPA: holo-ACP synthase [Acidobacteriota bacterium]|nr:holo-ACP synthase [Acidobacteriota bacterium]
MIVGVGIDIVEIARISRARGRWAGRFLRRLFTHRELDYCLASANRDHRLAARFAAKEAAFKALGTGLAAGCRWHDVEVVPDERGAPALELSGAAADIASRRGVRRSFVSLTHAAAYAAAVVVLES